MFKHRKFDRKVNARIRAWNRDIEQDRLWKGRFAIREVAKYYYRYEDNSGFEVNYVFAIVDKKTCKVEFAQMSNYEVLANRWGSITFYQFINDFIIRATQEENPRPSINNAENWVGKPIQYDKLEYLNSDWFGGLKLKK